MIVSHVYIENKSNVGSEGSYNSSEALLIDILLPFESGNYVLRKTNIIEKFVTEVNEIVDLVLEDFTCFEFGRSHKLGVMQAILNGIPVTNELIIEFNGKHLILAYDHIMPIQEFKQLHDYLMLKT